MDRRKTAVHQGSERGWKLLASRRLCGVLMTIGASVLSGTSTAQTVEYMHTDALGTPVVVTDINGNVKERSEYEPFGQLLNRPLNDGPGFTGHVQDATTGLTYMQQRYYDPTVGRFLSVDPISADGGTGANFNRYRYANNSPYRFTDPDGRRSSLLRFAGERIHIIQVSGKSGVGDVSGSNDGDIDGDGQADGRGSGGSAQPIADRPLPRGKGGEPAPDPEAVGVPHTQLGTGRKGDYPAAREFDANGKPVRDIHFTDHERPDGHANPHQHPYRDNPTGGTRQRGEAEPLDYGDSRPLDPGYSKPLDPGYSKPLDPGYSKPLGGE